MWLVTYGRPIHSSTNPNSLVVVTSGLLKVVVSACFVLLLAAKLRIESSEGVQKCDAISLLVAVHLNLVDFRRRALEQNLLELVRLALLEVLQRKAEPKRQRCILCFQNFKQIDGIVWELIETNFDGFIRAAECERLAGKMSR